MGDRANIVVKQHFNGTGELFLYTHWGGESLPATLQAALVRGREQRWDDECYFARIIVNEMTRGIEEELTGVGISLYPTDNEHDYLVVDCEQRTVTREDAESREAKHTWTFDEFCTLNLKRAFREF